MWDANAKAFDYDDEDTEVVDVEQQEPPLAPIVPIAVPRTRTEDVIVHVFINEHGRFHRRHPSTIKTSCGQHPVSVVFQTRREAIEHPLSRDCGCFTQAELDEADDTWRRTFPGVEPP